MDAVRSSFINRTNRRRRHGGALLGTALVPLLSATGSAVAQDATAPAADPLAGTGTVYAMTNSPVRNEVIAYARGTDSALAMSGRFGTDARGAARSRIRILR